VESRRRGLPGRSFGAKTGDASLAEKPGTDQRLLTSSPTGEFTAADAYIFERELEKLHPDNPVNKKYGAEIRQQLQVLPSPLGFDATSCDAGLLLHPDRGEWRLPQTSTPRRVEVVTKTDQSSTLNQFATNPLLDATSHDF